MLFSLLCRTNDYLSHVSGGPRINDLKGAAVNSKASHIILYRFNFTDPLFLLFLTPKGMTTQSTPFIRPCIFVSGFCSTCKFLLVIFVYRKEKSDDNHKSRSRMKNDIQQ